MRIPLIMQAKDDDAKDFWGNLTKGLKAESQMLKMASVPGAEKQLVKEGMVIQYRPPTGEYTVKLGHKADVVVTGVAKQESDLRKQVRTALNYAAHLSPKLAHEMEEIEEDKRNQFVYKDIDRCRDCVHFFSDTSHETYRDKCKNCTFATLGGGMDNFFPRSHHMIVYVPNWFDSAEKKPKSAFQGSLSLLDSHRTGSAHEPNAEVIASRVVANSTKCPHEGHCKAVCLGSHMMREFNENGINFQKHGKAVVDAIEKQTGIQIAIAGQGDKVIIAAEASVFDKEPVGTIVLDENNVSMDFIPRSAATPDAQKFVSKKIECLRDEGKPADQASAIAYNEAREEGYKVPEKKEASACKTPGALPKVRQDELDKYEEDVKDKMPESRQLKPQAPGKKVMAFAGTLCLAEVK